jgi:DNA-binding MarR family transcriptional regulator
MKYKLIQELIQKIEEFHSHSHSDNIEEFVIWLNTALFKNKKVIDENHHDNLLIPFKIMQLNKELKKQTKSVLSNSILSSIDEYSILLHLYFQDNFRKMEIIDLHNLEAPTGIEIINRLLKNKHIEEFSDKQDKRAKRIKITANGRKEIEKIRPQIDQIFNKFSSELNLNEKIHLSGLLNKIS